MTVADGTSTEAARLAAVRRYEILDTPPDSSFERITRLASRLLRTPIAIVSIVDEHRIWFKARRGLDVQEIERSPGLCSSAILQNDVWVVEDARRDPRTMTNPLVAGAFGLQFYAGAPLRTRDGHNLGTVCVIDQEPRTITQAERDTLEDLASIVIDEMELRLAARHLAQSTSERRASALQLNDDVVQSLAVARLALEAGDVTTADDHIERSLIAAKRILGDLGADAGSLRRCSTPGAGLTSGRVAQAVP